MGMASLLEITELEMQPQARERSELFLTEQLSQFVNKWDKVLVCVPQSTDLPTAELFGNAIRRCGAEPIFCGTDLRWKALLYLAFSSRTETIIGYPMTILGLAKLARISNIPLGIRNVVLPGYPCSDWVVEGISRILDCKIWRCFSPISWPLMAGFSCPDSDSVHLRNSEFGLEILAEDGSVAPDGVFGQAAVYPRPYPESISRIPIYARKYTTGCACGNPAPYVTDVDADMHLDETVRSLSRELLLWTSILDCKVEKTESGLSVEIVTFPGEKMPKLPSCARLVVRAWDASKDIPLELMAAVET